MCFFVLLLFLVFIYIFSKTCFFSNMHACKFQNYPLLRLYPENTEDDLHIRLLSAKHRHILKCSGIIHPSIHPFICPPIQISTVMEQRQGYTLNKSPLHTRPCRQTNKYPTIDTQTHTYRLSRVTLVAMFKNVQFGNLALVTVSYREACH